MYFYGFKNTGWYDFSEHEMEGPMLSTLGTDEEREAVWRAECHSLPATAGVGFQDHRQLLW